MLDIKIEERTVGGLLLRHVERTPDRKFITCGGESWTYGRLNADANRIASLYRSLGSAVGSKIAIMLPNSKEFILAWFGAVKASAVYVPINTEYRGKILFHQLALAEVEIIVTAPELAPRIDEVRAGLPLLRSVIVTGPLNGGLPGMNVVQFGTYASEPDVALPMLAGFSDPFAISYTSGTTGPSKGALASHCHVITFALDFIRIMEFERHDKLFTCMPLFHALGAWLGVVTSMVAGAEVLVTQKFSASRFWEDAAEFGATLGHTIFSMIPILMKQNPSATENAHQMRRVYTGQRNPEFEDRFNCKIVEVYGQSETGVVTGNWPGEEHRKGSSGRASTTFDVMIVDAFDNELPRGGIGELVVRPRKPYSMITEYYNMPKETVSAFRNLWFHTGDAGHMDEDGYFYFKDRKKDVVRRRGENISSYEVESVLNEHPSISEVAIVAVPSDLLEDELKAFVVARPGSTLSPDNIWLFCEERMPRFWVPRFIEFIESLPKTPTHKVEKHKLREMGSSGLVHDQVLWKKGF